MRVLFKLAFALLLGLAAFAGPHKQAAASAAGMTANLLTAAAHVSSPLRLASYARLYPARASFCYAQHIQCELDAGGYGYLYERCMRRRGCYPDHGAGPYPGDIYEYRRKGYSCRYWYGRCLDNWYYGEDIRGCMRYYGCLRHYY